MYKNKPCLNSYKKIRHVYTVDKYWIYQLWDIHYIYIVYTNIEKNIIGINMLMKSLFLVCQRVRYSREST